MEKKLTAEAAAPILQAMPYLIQFPSQRFWVDYDAEADGGRNYLGSVGADGYVIALKEKTQWNTKTS